MATTRTKAAPAYSRDLADLARRVHAAHLTGPHKPFLAALVREVRAATGQVHTADWYRGLMLEAGLTRKPSARTMSAVLVAARESAGEAPGPTIASVKELRRQMTGITRAVADMKDLLATVVATAKRQEQIAEGLGKRQMIFADQAQTYQRQIEQLTAMVQTALKQVSKEVDRMASAASDITLDSHRLAATVKQAAREIADAAQTLNGHTRP